MRSVCALVLGAVLAAGPATAVTTFVDVEFDRSAWEALVSDVTTDPFSNIIAQADVLEFDSGVESVAVGLNGVANHTVFEGRFAGVLRTSGSSAPGYLTFTWTFPEPVTAFGADFFSIGGSREVSVQEPSMPVSKRPTCARCSSATAVSTRASSV